MSDSIAHSSIDAGSPALARGSHSASTCVLIRSLLASRRTRPSASRRRPSVVTADQDCPW